MEVSTGNIVFDRHLDLEVLTLVGEIEQLPNHFHDYYELGFLAGGSRRVVCQNKEY